MSILSRCCCFKSVKNGSFATGLYTLILYVMILTAGSFHIHSVSDDLLLLIFTIVMVCLSALLVITSILLLIGLCGDNTNLMIPWLITLSVTTLLDVSVSVYLFFASDTDPFKIVLFIIDFIICIFNIYGFLCVLSYYLEITHIKSQIKFRKDIKYQSNRDRNDLYNGKRNGFCNKDNKFEDNEQSLALRSAQQKDMKRLSVKKEFRHELSVISEENSGIYIEPHRKISSDASSGGRTDTSQLMFSHEECSLTGIKSPIVENLHNISENESEDSNERYENGINNIIITNKKSEM